MEMDDNDEFCAMVKSILETKGDCGGFRSIQNETRQILGRNLNRNEQNSLTKILLEKSTFLDNIPPNSDQPSTHLQPRDHENRNIRILSHEILICMAYSKDYTIGNVCEVINSQYASRHGYQFYCEKIEYAKMMEVIEPRKHCAWYKALLIRNLLRSEMKFPLSTETQYSPLPKDWKYLVWIDADAIVINFNQSIEQILHNHFITSPSSPSSTPSSQFIFSDLIISQDFSSSSSCPLNTGVMIIQKTPWSQSLWEDVWSHPSCEKYHDVYFYDQSALVKCLKLRNVHLPSCSFEEEGLLCETTPLPPRIKIPRVQILPCALLNSNRISPRRLRKDLEQDQLMPPTVISSPVVVAVEDGRDRDQEESELLEYGLNVVDKELTEDMKDSPSLSSSLLKDGANFIFHAVGVWNKMKAILRVCELYGLLLPEEINEYCRNGGIEFRLLRGKCGGAPLLKEYN
jgi:hypothetical protein